MLRLIVQACGGGLSARVGVAVQAASVILLTTASLGLTPTYAGANDYDECIERGTLDAETCENFFGEEGDASEEEGGTPLGLIFALAGGALLIAALAIYMIRRSKNREPEGMTEQARGPGPPLADSAPVVESSGIHEPATPRSPELPPRNDKKDILWALALAFGAMGAGGLTLIPVDAFYFPLGAGAAGLALALVAWAEPGGSPWYAWVAVIASVGALVLGITAYSEFKDVQEKAEAAQQQLERIQDSLEDPSLGFP